MKETIGKAISLAFGLAMMGKEQMEHVVGEMVKKGEMTREESKAWIDAAVTKGKEVERAVEEAAKDHIQELLKEHGFVTKEEMESLAKRIERLEQHLQQH